MHSSVFRKTGTIFLESFEGWISDSHSSWSNGSETKRQKEGSAPLFLALVVAGFFSGGGGSSSLGDSCCLELAQETQDKQMGPVLPCCSGWVSSRVSGESNLLALEPQWQQLPGLWVTPCLCVAQPDLLTHSLPIPWTKSFLLEVPRTISVFFTGNWLIRSRTHFYILR